MQELWLRLERMQMSNLQNRKGCYSENNQDLHQKYKHSRQKAPKVEQVPCDKA